MADKWFLEPTANDTGGYFEFFRYVNNAADGLFFPVILLTIWFITFISMLYSGGPSRPSAAKALVFASFFTSVLAVPLAVLDFLAKRYMYISIVMLGIGVIWLILESGSE